MLVVRVVWFPCLHKIGRDSKFFSAGSTQGDEGWREAGVVAQPRGHADSPPRHRPRQDRARKVRRRRGGGPRPGSEATAGSAAAFFLTSPGRRSHPGSSPPPRLLLTWVRDEGFSVAGAGGTGARGRTSGKGQPTGAPEPAGPQGPAARPSRLTQIAEAPGEEPLAARGSRLLPPSLLSLGLPACFSPPAES